MNGDVTDWLIEEISDLIDTGPVGLYEFVWALRSGRLGLREDELRDYASAALERLLRNGQGDLVWMEWPGPDPVASAHGVAINSESWNDPPEIGYYLAFMGR